MIMSDYNNLIGNLSTIIKLLLISVFPAITTYISTDLLYTAADIIFFWVARMIMMGIYVMGDVPFKTVNFHGLVRDAKGQKMSIKKRKKIKKNGLITRCLYA